MKPILYMRVFILILGLTANSCTTMRERSYGHDGMPTENHASKHKDFSPEEYKSSFKTDISMGYRVGDRFRTKQQMFIIYSVSGAAYLVKPNHIQSPPVSEYLKNPGAYRYGGGNPYQVIKLVPSGTVIKIVKIAKYDSAPYPYFVISGDSDWFRSAVFADYNSVKDREGKKTMVETYNKDLFQKL